MDIVSRDWSSHYSLSPHTKGGGSLQINRNINDLLEREEAGLSQFIGDIESLAPGTLVTFVTDAPCEP